MLNALSVRSTTQLDAGCSAANIPFLPCFSRRLATCWSDRPCSSLTWKCWSASAGVLVYAFSMLDVRRREVVGTTQVASCQSKDMARKAWSGGGRSVWGWTWKTVDDGTWVLPNVCARLRVVAWLRWLPSTLSGSQTLRERLESSVEASGHRRLKANLEFGRNAVKLLKKSVLSISS